MIIAAAMLTASLPSTTAHGQVACRYEVAATMQVPPCFLGDRQVAAVAISPNGRYVCGFYCQCLCNPYESFVYDMQTGVMFTIPRPPGINTSMANDVSDAGLVVGFMEGNADYGYVYDYPAQTYVMTLTSPVPNGFCYIQGINSSNTVCGTRVITGPPDYLTSAFIKTDNGPIVDLGLIDGLRTEGVGINDAGQVLVTQGADSSALIWNGKGPLTHVPQLSGGSGMWARGIGAQGQVVGSSLVAMSSEYRFPFLYVNGVTTALPRLLGPTSTALAYEINSDGVIAGYCSQFQTPFDPRACLWWGGEAIALQPRLVVGTGVIVRNANSISENGLIICHTYGSPVVLRPIPGLVGDVNCDGVVDRWDLLEVIAHWGLTESTSDVNHDHVVNVADLLSVIIHWTY